MEEQPKISVIGAGMFGYALAYVYGKRYPEAKIFLYDVDEEVISGLRETRKHKIHFKEKILVENVVPTSDLKEAVSHAEMLLMAVPAQFMRKAVEAIKPHIDKDTIIIDLAKALELNTGKRMSQVIGESLEGIPHKCEICVLAGGMLAGDVIDGNPICAEVASEDEITAKRIASVFSTPNIRLYTNTDVLGVELAGALKNVVAIAAGMFDGLFKKEGNPVISSKSGLVSRAAKEIKRVALAMGADAHTFDPGSQAWFGDLMTTCFGSSRNRLFGERVQILGSVESALDELKKQNKLVEGYATAKVLHNICKENGIEFPVCEQVYLVLYEGKNPKIAAAELMSRPLKRIGE